MSRAISEIAIGAAAVGIVALDILAPQIGLAFTPQFSAFLISAGSSLIIGGIGTLLAPNTNGLSTATRNAIAPWNAVYGRAKVGGTMIYIEETGNQNKYLHLVMVLACHRCQSVDSLLFDNQLVLLDVNGNSFSPSQQYFGIQSVTRANDVCTITLSGPLTLDLDGQTLQIQNVNDHSFNGQYKVTEVNSTTLTYICGGNPGTSYGGSVHTLFPNYGTNVHMETLLGNHMSTFPGLLSGSNGLWTSAHQLLGRTAVYLRLQYSQNLFANGLPTISLLLNGKNDILDPRTGVAGYTENSALCIADYLAQPSWGFKASYGTEIPTAPLITAANICDEAVPLAAGGNEPRYSCNGTFPLSTKRGEVLQNMLTSCGGRITYSGGQFVIHPAGWPGLALYIGGPQNGNWTPNGATAPDFTITATPASQTVPASGSVSFSVSIAQEHGFTGTVNLSVSGLPNGATAVFSPTSIPYGSGTSTLTVTLSSVVGAGAGTYALTVTGTSGALTHSTQVSFTGAGSALGGNLQASLFTPVIVPGPRPAQSWGPPAFSGSGSFNLTNLAPPSQFDVHEFSLGLAALSVYGPGITPSGPNPDGFDYLRVAPYEAAQTYSANGAVTITAMSNGVLVGTYPFTFAVTGSGNYGAGFYTLFSPLSVVFEPSIPLAGLSLAWQVTAFTQSGLTGNPGFYPSLTQISPDPSFYLPGLWFNGTDGVGNQGPSLTPSTVRQCVVRQTTTFSSIEVSFLQYQKTVEGQPSPTVSPVYALTPSNPASAPQSLTATITCNGHTYPPVSVSVSAPVATVLLQLPVTVQAGQAAFSFDCQQDAGGNPTTVLGFSLNP